MADPDANDAVFDPDLDARFSHPVVPAPPADGSAAHGDQSLFWPAADPSLSLHPPQTPFQNFVSLPPNHEAVAAQTNTPQYSVGQQQYPEDAAYQASWPAGDDSAQAGPSSVYAPTGKPFACPYQGCTNSYDRQCDLDKHINNHIKPRECDLCPASGAETKDLNRHMWVHHPDEARIRGVPKEEDRCPMCEYVGRKDNVKRHKDLVGHW